eukprot:g37129.t1
MSRYTLRKRHAEPFPLYTRMEERAPMQTPSHKRQKLTEDETTTPPKPGSQVMGPRRETKSDSELVREFTAGAGQPTPSRPELMTKDEVTFLGKMLLDEILELYSTVMPAEEAVRSLKTNLDAAKQLPQMVDALVDIYYYSLNAAAKKGHNISRVFQIVHAANMAKRDPVSGKFLKRADGKIIKPEGWQPPDIESEIALQLKDGSFP